MIKKREFDADKWLKKHMGELVDKFPGEYIVVAEGKLYRGETPSRLRKKAKAEHPEALLMGIRVPHPQDFTCALIVL